MKKNPRLRLDHRFTHLVIADDTFILVGDEDSIVLEGSLPGDVVRLLDGSRTAVEVATMLEDRHRADVVHYVILHLERSGLVHGVDERATPVDGPASGTLADDELADRLERAWSTRAGENVVRLGVTGSDGGAIELVLTDDYLHPELVGSVGVGREAGRPLLLASLGFRRVWIGPGVAFGLTACIACLQDRLRLNLTARTLVHLDDSGMVADVVVEPLLSVIPRSAFTRLASAIREVLGDPAWSVEDQPLLVLPLDGGAPQAHGVARLPQCPVCGDPSLTPPGADVELRSRPRAGRSDGGYRVVDPQDTLDRYSELVSPLTGVVRRLRRVEVEGTDLVNVYTASHAHHYGFANVRAVKDDRRDHSGGKGKTDLDARVSALCESLERFSSVHRGTEPVRLARLSELGDRALHPETLMLFSEEQFRTRVEWNERQEGGFQSVPERYDDEPIGWSQVRSLSTNDVWLVPAASLYIGYSGAGKQFCAGDSNGLAGGNCLEEAILQGFLELAERDAIALWWYNRALRPEIDLRELDDSWIDDLLAYYRGLSRRVWVLDLTTDLGIPTFVALSMAENRREDIIFGFGAHLDAHIALVRALTELNQMLPTVMVTPDVRRRRLLPEFADAVEWWDSATVAGHPYLLPSADRATRSLDDFSRPETKDLRDDIFYCLDRANAVGCDVLVHDLTRPDVGYAVAKIIAPGLRHFWRRLAPGRLYEVPVQLGWIESTLGEHQMNPVSMFV